MNDDNLHPVVEAGPDDAGTGHLPYPVVAIGASAGGLEAYIQLLSGLPADTGATFVVLPHLSAEHRATWWAF